MLGTDARAKEQRLTEVRATLERGLAGRYAIEDEAGRGGMAVVYRARDLKHDRVVALKVLRPGLLASAGAQRFLREIRVVAGLVHPHILPLHDSGDLPGATPILYYVMPLVVGESLRGLLDREGRLPVDRAVRITRQVANALDYAHRNGVIHRDVKPENILLHEGEALVADFGVARFVSEARGVGPGGATPVETQGEGDGAAGDRDTQPGLIVGTPAYMSPEQVGGDTTLDGRADQYALGCVLYEMLAGEPPFSGPAARVLTRQLTEKAPSVRATRPDVPLAIEQVLDRALAKDPDRRYPSAAAFANALATPLAGVTVEATRSRSDDRARLAVLPFVNLSGDPEHDYLSDGLTDELLTTLSQVPHLWVASRSSTYALRGAPHDVRGIGTLLGVDTVLEGSIRTQGDQVRITAQLTDTRDGGVVWTTRVEREARDLFGLLEDIARSIVRTLRGGPLPAGAPGGQKRYTESTVAYSRYLKGRHHWNRRTFEGIREAMRHFESAIEADPGFALAVSGLADAYALGVDYRGAPVEDGMARAREEAQRALRLDDSLAEAHTSLAWVTFIHDWDWPRAGYHFRRAIELDPRYATARQWHAWYLAAMGRVQEAVDEARLAVTLDPASASIRRGVGWLYYIARDPGSGEDELRRAVVMDPESPDTHVILGLCLMTMGDLNGAEEAVREALAIDAASTHAMAMQGRLRVLQGRPDEARAIRDRIIALSRERYVSPTDIVKIHLALRETDGVFEALERAHAERRGFLVYLRVEPLFDPVRSDPRFQDLLKRMRLD